MIPGPRATTTYAQYLMSGWWQTRRLKFLSRARNRWCHACGKLGVKLEIHHRTYERLWAERSTDLVALCKTCHLQAHAREVILRKLKPTLNYAERLLEATTMTIRVGRAHRDGMTL